MEKTKEMEKLTKVSKLLNIKSLIEERGNMNLTYYGLKSLTPDNKYPLFVAWNHKYPIIGVGSYIPGTTQSQALGNYQETYMPLPRAIGEAIELFLGNATDSEDFELQIEEAFKRKNECQKK